MTNGCRNLSAKNLNKFIFFIKHQLIIVLQVSLCLVIKLCLFLQLWNPSQWFVLWLCQSRLQPTHQFLDVPHASETPLFIGTVGVRSVSGLSCILSRQCSKQSHLVLRSLTTTNRNHIWTRQHALMTFDDPKSHLANTTKCSISCKQHKPVTIIDQQETIYGLTNSAIRRSTMTSEYHCKVIWIMS